MRKEFSILHHSLLEKKQFSKKVDFIYFANLSLSIEISYFEGYLIEITR